MSADRYLTLGIESEGSYREKASRFIACAFPVADEASFKERYERIAREHHTSRHVCFAWVLGDAGERARANDAGEPSGTAGKPMLRQLVSAQLTYSAVVVVRYFGGTLLGKAGLVHAYAEAARQALAANTTVTHVLRDRFIVTCGYAMVEMIRAEASRNEGEITEVRYGEPCELHVALARSTSGTFAERWTIAGAVVVRDQPK